MTKINISSNSFIEELKRIISTIVWKNKELANFYELNIDPFYADMFMAAHRGMITFDSIPSFPQDVLSKIGLAEEGQIDLCVSNKNYIPESKRDSAVSAYINHITEFYEEENDYYRMLYGLPPIKEDKYFYIINQKDREILDSLKAYRHIIKYDEYYIYCIEKNRVDLIPVHKLDDVTLFKYDSLRLFDKILEIYPNCKYLKHLTKYKIDLYTARAADRYDILYIDHSDPDVIVEDFKEVYNLCKNYIVRVFYTDAYRSNNKYYEGFIGMCILLMSIQQMYYKYLESNLTRDFYDLSSLRVIYESYGVPFFEEVPLKYHQKIVRNINKLISYKGSSQVLIDLFNIFDFKILILNQYYLVKKHKLDEDGNPIFSINGYNNDGSPIYNYEDMYELSFTETEIGKDPYSSILDPTKTVKYESITDKDEYWVNDRDLIEKLYTSEFNFIESKYLGVSLIFDLNKITYECCYFMKMLQDNRNTTNSKIYVYHDYIEEEILLFDLVIYTICLICKNRGYVALIPYKVEQISKLYGFEFKNDLGIIQQDIMNNPLLDNEICNIIKDMNINIKSDVDKVYSNISKLIEFLNYKIETSKDRKTYEAYKELRESLLTSECLKDIYCKTDGSLANSYEDLLKDLNSKLFDRLNSELLNILDEIDYCLFLLKKLASDLDEFDSAADMSKLNILIYLTKLLNFFKSAKVDMTDFNVIYTLGSRSTDLIKYFMENYKILTITEMNDITNYLFNDEIYKIYTNSTEEAKLNIVDVLHLYSKIVKYADPLMDDLMVFDSKLSLLKQNINIEDYIIFINIIMPFNDNSFMFKDDLYYHRRKSIYLVESNIKDKFHGICLINSRLKDNLYIDDDLSSSLNKINIKTNVGFTDSIERITE